MDTLKRLDELIEDHETTLFDLAKKSNINYSTLHAAKRRGSQLSVDTIERVCAGLGILPFEFFMNDEDWTRIEEYVLQRSERHEH